MIPEIKLTSAGAALLAKVPAGEAAPLTRWQFGTGALISGESIDRTALVAPLGYIPLDSVTVKGDRATVLGQFTNVGRAAFTWEELGLWAEGPDGGEVLLCYGNAFGAGERIQAGSDQLREFVFGTELIFSGDAKVTAVIDQSLVFIPKSEKAKPDGVATLGPDGKVPEDQLPGMNYIPTADKGKPGGVATLDETGKVPEGQLPPMDYDPAGSAQAVRNELIVHTGNRNNPHEVQAAQIPCLPWDSVAHAIADLNRQISGSGETQYGWLKYKWVVEQVETGASFTVYYRHVVDGEERTLDKTDVYYASAYTLDPATGRVDVGNSKVNAPTTIGSLLHKYVIPGQGYTTPSLQPHPSLYYLPDGAEVHAGRNSGTNWSISSREIRGATKYTIKQVDVEYLYADSENAYPKNTVKDGYYYKYLGQIEGEAIPRIITGSYVGNGTTNVAIAFPRAPKLVCIYNRGSGSASNGWLAVFDRQSPKVYFGRGSVTGYKTLTWTKSTVTMSSSPPEHLNENGVTYGYIALL